ncbi:MAG: hypothetical protein AABY28_06990 [Candidatus Omnitrophota bacterium]
MSKKVEYIIPLSGDTQLRHIHTHWKDKVTSFVVQLEIYINDKWQPIVRYDTAHGFTHRDIIHPDGAKDKTPLPISGFKEALTFSDRDLKTNWRIYKIQFLKEVKKNG